MAFASERFSLQPIGGKGNPGMLTCVAKVSNRFSLKIRITKQILQRLLITLENVKAVNRSENLLNEASSKINY